MIMPPTLFEFSSNQSQLRDIKRHQIAVINMHARATAAMRKRGVRRM